MKHHFPGLKKDHTAAGTLRWRVRMEGNRNKLTKIPMGPGEPGFDEHYHAARAGQKLEVAKPVRANKGTLDELCDRFLVWMKGQVDAGNLSAMTLSSRRTGLAQACETRDPDGDRTGALDADLPREAFIYIRDAFAERTGAAATCLKALRAAYAWGEDRGYPSSSPVFSVKSGHRSKGGAIPWSAHDVERFLATHGPGTMARLWFCLSYDSHGRIGDMHWLGCGNEAIHNGDPYLEWQPSKKGSAFVSIPLGEMLATELQYHEDRDTYLVTEYGKPFASAGSLDNRVRKWIIAAGLSKTVRNEAGEIEVKATRSQHGIRKGVAELMAERGATEYELMAAFGWTDTKTPSIYTKKFERRGAATSGMKRLPRLTSGPRPENCGPHSSPNANKIGISEEEWQPVGAFTIAKKTIC